ncbi:DUF2235 domain-containing protein [Flavobacterium sp.]|uniref:T6SS phospholipase effector Tle1-like catalytic domain-containing protein n=1 Tax=Flavobacterium sp. TaxID=239 RepID=UPI0012010691|nr:DUF2235 domain-containing protein [Flavobacterium sp.]RZJ70724.1 MAG: DUF2235 domain-containing protein [Flavobacterium sp.]
MAENVTFGTYEASEFEDITAVRVHIDVYFDGTLNNMYNSEHFDNNSPEFQKSGGNKKKKDSSYYNDKSNVARLWEVSRQDTKIYIDGIGTEKGKKDSTMGFAFGSGDTGVIGKVSIGCDQVVEKVGVKIQGYDKVSLLILDVFGFSRGSAAARNFVHEVGRKEHKSRMMPVSVGETIVMQRQDDDGNPTSLETVPEYGQLGVKLKAANHKVDKIIVRYLGIFDTVSSYHPTLSLRPNFRNDVDELHLNHIGHSMNVVHFTAENEHRTNFSLTHSPVGMEKSFPGVHSDIGGSYKNGTEVVEEIETTWTNRNRLNPLKEKLVADGWYNPDQLEITGGNFYFALQGTRELRNTYSFIPLHFMAEIGKTKLVPFDTDTLEKEKYSIEKLEEGYTQEMADLLKRVKAKLRAYVFDGGPAYSFIPSHVMPPNAEQQDLRKLRNKFLHWSARREGIGMDPNSDRKRIVY